MQTASTDLRPNIVTLPHPEPNVAAEAPLLLRVEEAARLLSVGRSTTYELIASGELAAVHIGRSVRIPRQEIEDWVRRKTAETHETDQ